MQPGEFVLVRLSKALMKCVGRWWCCAACLCEVLKVQFVKLCFACHFTRLGQTEGLRGYRRLHGSLVTLKCLSHFNIKYIQAYK